MAPRVSSSFGETNTEEHPRSAFYRLDPTMGGNQYKSDDKTFSRVAHITFEFQLSCGPGLPVAAKPCSEPILQVIGAYLGLLKIHNRHRLPRNAEAAATTGQPRRK